LAHSAHTATRRRRYYGGLAHGIASKCVADPRLASANLTALTIENTPKLEFADPGPVRDQVVADILAGPKTTVGNPRSGSDLLLSGYATRLLGHALTRRSVTCHRVPLKTRGTLLHDQ
jgi:hypothetical protein